MHIGRGKCFPDEDVPARVFAPPPLVPVPPLQRSRPTADCGARALGAVVCGATGALPPLWIGGFGRFVMSAFSSPAFTAPFSWTALGLVTLFTLQPELVAVPVQAAASSATATIGAVSLFIAIGITQRTASPHG